MHIGVFKEVAPRERRVALSPDAVTRLVKSGHRVSVEAGAGESSFFADSDYQSAGAMVAGAEVVAEAELVVAVQRPNPDRSNLLREGCAVAALLGPNHGDAVEAMNRRGATVLALERVPRITRAQSMDVLSSQATVAGYRSVLLATNSMPRFLPMLTTAAGSVPPGRVLVIGAGVAGLQAIATARRLGGIVSGFDIRPAAAEQVESLGAKFIAPQALDTAAETAGGYARELQEEQQRLVLEALSGAVSEVDLVIATAAIPGKPAPCLITREMVESMKPGAVIVDVAAETGGNCALTRPGETVLHGDVTVIGALNLPSGVPQHASRMFGRNIQVLAEHLAPEGELAVDLSDPITDAMCVAHRGSWRIQEGR